MIVEGRERRRSRPPPLRRESKTESLGGGEEREPHVPYLIVLTTVVTD